MTAVSYATIACAGILACAPHAFGATPIEVPPPIDSACVATDPAVIAVAGPVDEGFSNDTSTVDTGRSAPTPASDSVASRPSTHEERHHGFFHGVAYTAGCFVSDTWAVFSSPLHMDRKDALWTIGVLGIGAAIYSNDEAIVAASRRNREAPGYKQFLQVGNAIEPVGFIGRMNPYYAGSWLVGRVFHIGPVERIAPEIIESDLIAGSVRDVAKQLVGRRHPFENLGPHAFAFGKGGSFPSGHTSAAFELATILSHHVNRTPFTVVAYGLATSVAFQRFHTGAHWPSDCFIPAVTGTLIARTIVRRNEERRESHMEPMIDPVNGRIGIRRRF
jgi:hypothetical protein